MSNFFYENQSGSQLKIGGTIASRFYSFGGLDETAEVGYNSW